MAKINWLDEPYIYFWLIAFLIFVNLTYSFQVAGIYIAMTVGNFILFYMSNGGFIPKISLNKPKNTPRALLATLLFMGIFVALSIGIGTVLQGVVSTPATSFASLINNWLLTNPQATSNPIFAESWIMTLIVFGLLIPIVETIFAVKMFYFLASFFSINDQRLGNWKMWVLAGFTGALWVWYHYQAKQVGSQAALLLVFVFFTMTCLVTLPSKWTDKEAEPAIYAHIINNVMATLKNFKVI